MARRAALAALALLLAACGVKTEPWPALDVLPGPARDLTETLTPEGEALLSWSPPAQNMIGRPLAAGTLTGFRVEVAETPAAAYCDGCPARYATADTVAAVAAGPGDQPPRYAWRHPLNRDSVYRFRVVSLGRGGNSHPQGAVVAQARAAAAPGALAGFRLEVGDRQVRLAWDRPAPGQAAQVQKLGSDGQWRDLPGLSGDAHTDLDVAYENAYRYRGRLTARQGEALAVGPWSGVLTAEVADTTPPNPPGYLDAAVTPAGVRLKWEDALEPDVAGYRLYRQREGGAFRRVGGGTLTANEYLDDSLPLGGGEMVRYRVTAVDTSPRANESRPSPVADVYLDDNPAPPERPE